jgi:uncharacterized membrane protein
MQLWLIPMVYVAASVVCGLGLPRIEQLYLSSYTFDLSVSSAQACLSAAASGMMALSGIVFAMAFVMVQFSAIAYSPRLVLWFARDRTLFHSLGVFAATFIFSLFALAWIDRGGSGRVPLFSTLLVAIMLILSMLLFSRLVQRITDLQITNVLHFIGDKGREVIRETFQRLVAHSVQGEESETTHIEGAQLGLPTQMLRYSGYPCIIARLDMDALARQAQLANGIIVMTCAVGDTLRVIPCQPPAKGGRRHLWSGHYGRFGTLALCLLCLRQPMLVLFVRTSHWCQNVWPGRAVQDELPRSTNVRAAASMYQVSCAGRRGHDTWRA